MDPEEPKQVSKGRLVWRMMMLPVAFAWLAFLVTAPFALVDDRVAYGAIAFGLGLGIAVLIVQPRWAKKVLSVEPKQPSKRRKIEVPQNLRIGMTVFALALATAIGWFLLNSDLKDRSLLVLIAVLLLIDFVRRPLRRAWGVYGSAAGLVISGGLVVLLIRAMGDQEDMWAVPYIAGALIFIETFGEYQALKRAGQLTSE
jgi:hypothetical protein